MRTSRRNNADRKSVWHSSSGRTTNYADYEDYDEGYEDYGELGSNFSPRDDPNWGYDNYDTYEDSTHTPNSNNRRAPRNIDFSNTVNSQAASYNGKAPNRIDFGNARTEYYDDYGYEDYGELGSNYTPEDDPNWGYDDYDGYGDYEARTYATDSRSPRSGGEANAQMLDKGRAAPKRLSSSVLNSALKHRRSAQGDDLSRYLDYLEQYDRGDIDNYEMSRIQRAYADNPFWETFQPSDDLIRKYGNGNESTRWPMFRQEGSRWVPEVWRND